MKKLSLSFLAAIVMFVAATFTSCLGDSNDSRVYDFSTYMTVESNGTYAVADNGMNLTIMNPSALQRKDGNTPSRVFAYCLVDGEFDVNNMKSAYNVKIATEYTPSEIPTVALSKAEDIEKCYSVLRIYDMWACNGYLNVPIIAKVDPNVKIDSWKDWNKLFQAYFERAENDTIYLRLANLTEGSYNYEDIFSFPINTLLTQLIQTHQITPKDGKISIVVSSAYKDDNVKASCTYELN